LITLIGWIIQNRYSAGSVGSLATPWSMLECASYGKQAPCTIVYGWLLDHFLSKTCACTGDMVNDGFVTVYSMLTVPLIAQTGNGWLVVEPMPRLTFEYLIQRFRLKSSIVKESIFANSFLSWLSCRYAIYSPRGRHPMRY